MSTLTLLTARWVCPMNRPPIKNGVVAVVDQRIEAVDAANIRLRFANAPTIDFGEAALLPGLINLHTHLELTNRPRINFDGDVVSWLLRQRPAAQATPDQHQRQVESATRAGIEQCLRFGVTCIGDISQQPQWTRPTITRSALRATSFGEILGLGKLRSRTREMIERAATPLFDSSCVRSGLSPHAPYTVDLRTLLSCIRTADQNDLQIAMHLGEFSAESEFLVKHEGPFRTMWESIGLWCDDIQTCRREPIAMAASVGLLDGTDLLIHVNYASDEDIQTLAAGKASVIFCPRTHAYFCHPPHRWRDMLAAGINVAVGTDSCASSPDLNIVDDLRLLRRDDPTIAVGLLWSLVTTRAAVALRQSDLIGDLASGKAADFSVFPVIGDHPLEEILDRDDCNCVETWIGGQKVQLA